MRQTNRSIHSRFETLELRREILHRNTYSRRHGFPAGEQMSALGYEGRQWPLCFFAAGYSR
jgi:hypothetical protein